MMREKIIQVLNLLFHIIDVMLRNMLILHRDEATKMGPPQSVAYTYYKGVSMANIPHVIRTQVLPSFALQYGLREGKIFNVNLAAIGNFRSQYAMDRQHLLLDTKNYILADFLSEDASTVGCTIGIILSFTDDHSEKNNGSITSLNGVNEFIQPSVKLDSMKHYKLHFNNSFPTNDAFFFKLIRAYAIKRNQLVIIQCCLIHHDASRTIKTVFVPWKCIRIDTTPWTYFSMVAVQRTIYYTNKEVNFDGDIIYFHPARVDNYYKNVRAWFTQRLLDKRTWSNISTTYIKI